MDRLRQSEFLDELHGSVFLSQDRAIEQLAHETDAAPEGEDHWQARGLI